MHQRKDYFGLKYTDIDLPQLYKLGGKSNVKQGMYHFKTTATLKSHVNDNEGQRRRLQIKFRPDEYLTEYHLSNFIKDDKRVSIKAIPSELLQPLAQQVMRLVQNCEDWLMDKNNQPYAIDGEWGKFWINDSLGTADFPTMSRCKNCPFQHCE